jgi:hypothetical protein
MIFRFDDNEKAVKIFEKHSIKILKEEDVLKL